MFKYVGLKDLSGSDVSEANRVVKEAKTEKFLDGSFSEGHNANRKFIIKDGVLVGYFTPVPTTIQGVRRWRAGALYMAKRHRGKGLMVSFLKEFFETKKGVAWINILNTPSIRTFERVGFYKDKEKIHDSEIGHWYLKD